MSDWTGNNARQLNNTTFNNLVASRQWQAWLQKRFKDNAPYDKIVEGIVTAGTREPGESYQEYCESMTKAHRDMGEFAKRESMPYYWMRRDFRQPDERAISFAHAFLGVRISVLNVTSIRSTGGLKTIFKSSPIYFDLLYTVAVIRGRQAKSRKICSTN